MVKATFVLRLHEESAFADVKPGQVHGPVSAIGRAVRLEAVDLHFGRQMVVPTRFSPKGRAVATEAIGLAAKNGLATLRGRPIEVHLRSRFWRRQGQLVVVKSGQFGSNLVFGRSNRNVAKTGGSSNRPAIGIIQSRVEEAPFAAHFQDSNQRIPVGHGAPTARPGMEVVTEEAKSIRNECRRGATIGPEGFAIEQELGIE